jgi:hypothetical protein
MLTTMLRSIKEIYGYSVRSTDLLLGRVRELYLNEGAWTIQSIETEGGLHVPAASLEEVDATERSLFFQIDHAEMRTDTRGTAALDAGLKPARQLLGLEMHAQNGSVGYVEDLIVSDADLSIKYLVVNAASLGHNKKFIVSPWWIHSVHWDTNEVVLRFDLEHVLRSPRYDFQMPVSREYESALHEYYDKQTYWV